MWEGANVSVCERSMNKQNWFWSNVAKGGVVLIMCLNVHDLEFVAMPTIA
jgi:hypothetical protein